MEELPALSPEQCTLLAEAVRTNTDVAEGMENLNLSGLHLHKKTPSCPFSCTVTTKTLTAKKKTRSPGITAEGAQEEYCTIFEALPYNSSITTVAFGPGTFLNTICTTIHAITFFLANRRDARDVG